MVASVAKLNVTLPNKQAVELEAQQCYMKLLILLDYFWMSVNVSATVLYTYSNVRG